MSEESKFQSVSDEFFKGVSTPTFEKPILEKVTAAKIIEVSDIKANPEDTEGTDKKGNKFLKFWFDVKYKLKTPFTTKEGNEITEFRESYSFKLYIKQDGKKELSCGSLDSAMGNVFEVMKKHLPNINERSDIVTIRETLRDKDVMLISKMLGINHSNSKVVIDSFVNL
jgi:hypothetical protein